MPGQLKITLVVPYIDATQVPALRQKIEDFLSTNTEFKLDKLEFSEIARRPIEEMMVDALTEISKKLDELKLSQEE